VNIKLKNTIHIYLYTLFDFQNERVIKRQKLDNEATNGEDSKKRKLEMHAEKTVLTLSPLLKQAGHTGYLTFCFVPPGIHRPVLLTEP